MTLNTRRICYSRSINDSTLFSQLRGILCNYDMIPYEESLTCRPTEEMSAISLIQWRSERGGLGVQPPHCEKMYIFYCLVFEQKQWLSLYFFNSVRNSLSDDVNGHSGIKETRVCDCVTINYRDAAYTDCRVLYTHCNVICYQLDSLRVNYKRLTR